MKSKSMNNFMEECRICIFNAADDLIISTRMLPFGYDQTKHEANKILYGIADELIGTNKIEHAEYDTARIEFNNTLASARKNYDQLIRPLKYWYDSSSMEALKLALYTGKTIKYTDFVKTAKEFYKELAKHPEVLNKLLPFGHTPEAIEQYKADITSLDDLRATREKESGDAQYAIKERDSKMEELAEVVADIKKLAKLVFTDDEAQYLEKLGIIVKS